MPRPKEPISRADLMQVARMFHLEMKTRSKIAQEMNIANSKVTTILNEIRKRGLVSVQLFETPESRLEQQIRDKYPHLERVMIAPGPQVTTPAECNELFRSFGRLAADYFMKLYARQQSGRPLHVGVTGGARLLEFANAVPTMHRDNVFVHAAALAGRGKLRDKTSHIEPSVAASILWTHCGSFPGHCEYETVEPYRVGNIPGVKSRKRAERELDRLSKIASVEEVIRDMDNLDIVFAGFGFIDGQGATEAMENRMTMASLLESVVTSQTLAEEGAVGDFCYCPFDANGNCLPDKHWQFFLTAGHYSDHPGIAFFKHMVATGKKVVGFGGPYLLPTIQAALKGKIVNVLIIDGPTARQLAEGD